MAAANEAQRDLDLLQHIRRYCNDAIDAAHQANTESAFMEGRLYQCRCYVRIGNWRIIQTLIRFFPSRSS